MKGYSYAEVGMLLGAAVGGIISAIGFAFTDNYLFFIVVAVGIAVGLNLGNNMDKKACRNKKRKIDL